MKQFVLLVVLMITLQCAPPEADAYDKKNIELAQLACQRGPDVYPFT